MDEIEVESGYGKPVHSSRWAKAVLVASILSALVFFLVIPALIMVFVALFVQQNISALCDGRGYRLAGAAKWVSALSASVGFLGYLFISSVGHHPRELSNRSVCAANLRGIAQSMALYAESNSNRFPVVPFAAYDLVRNEPHGNSTGTDNLEEAMRTEFSGNGGLGVQAGCVPACMWLMVLSEALSSKQFLCKSDPAPIQSAEVRDGAGNCYDNFQDGNRLSYSCAYPWNSAGLPGAWWKNSNDASLPLIADMTPKQGTGTPARDLVTTRAPTQNSTWNSANHNGEGQNVGFADGHAEWNKTPDAGQNHDNIYSISNSPSHGPAQFGGIPAGAAAPDLRAERPPFDVVMLPVRDATTGGM